MAVSVVEIRALLISPSDVLKERNAAAEAVTMWNAHMGPLLGARIHLVRWEVHSSPELRGDPQAVINRQLVDACDFGIAVFWSRIGTPTGRYTSGSIEEIERLRASGKRVMLYFSKRPADAAKSPQSDKLRRLRSQMEKQGLVGYFDRPGDLSYSLQAHLTDAVKDVLDRVPARELRAPLAAIWATEEVPLVSGAWNLSAMSLPSREALYESIATVLETHEGPLHIRATATLHNRLQSGDAPFRRYMDSVAEACRKCAELGLPSSYTVVLSYTPSKDRRPPVDRRKSIRYRIDSFESANIGNRALLFQIPHFGYFDMVTVGEEYTFIGFPARANDLRLNSAIRLFGRPFASQINHWFDTCVLPYTRLIDKRNLRVV